MTNKLPLFVTIIVIIFIFTSCLAGQGKNTPAKPAGFFRGIWHGWIAPFALIAQLFNRDLRIYEIHNNGILYELGFYMAIISGFGSLNIFRQRRKKIR